MWGRPLASRQRTERWFASPKTDGHNRVFSFRPGLDDIKDLPGFDEMKAAGLLSTEPSGLFSDLASAEDEEDEEEEEEEY